MRNVQAVAEAAGTSLDAAVRLTIYTTDLGAFADINEVYGGFFGDEPPARAAVGVAALPKGALVEIDAILHAPA
jgi:2-iminobutanoate/2-iminopropanoate deaminase